MSNDSSSGSRDAAGFVLAGGRSSRMGAEKALAVVAGEPLIVHGLRILRQAGLSASIAGARAQLEEFAPVVVDTEPDRGPLGGICAALASASSQLAVFIPVDLPLLPPSLVSLLVEEARNCEAAITVPSFGGFTQTFPAVIHRAALPYLRAALDGGDGGCFSAFQAAAAALDRAVNVVVIEEAMRDGRLAATAGLPSSEWFLNLNEPGDLVRAEACLSGRKL